ncbi:MAG: hypothetical protein V3V19_09540 [Cocleimonas sp.]
MYKLASLWPPVVLVGVLLGLCSCEKIRNKWLISSPDAIEFNDEPKIELEHPKTIVSKKIHLDHCMGSSLLDTWAYFAPTGPDYPVPSHDGYRGVSELYFKGELDAARIALNETPFDPNFELTWKVGDEFHKLYMDYVPQVYLGMCFNRTDELKALLPQIVSLSIGLDNKPEKAYYDAKVSYHAKLLAWEIKLTLANQSQDLAQFEKLMTEVDGFLLFKGADISDTSKLRAASDLKYFNLKARVYSYYAILNDDPVIYLQALKIFEFVENNFARHNMRRQSIFSTADISWFSVKRFTRAMNLLHWMDSIQKQIQHRPAWLQDYSEQLDDYEKRIMTSFNSPNSHLCRVTTKQGIQKFVKHREKQLQCRPIEQITYTSMKLKTRKFTNLSNQLSKELVYEDSPMLWAQHQYTRYLFYRDYVYTHKEQWHTKRVEEFCYSKRALDNTLHVLPNIKYEKGVMEWC